MKIKAIKIPINNLTLKNGAIPLKSEIFKQFPDDTALYKIEPSAFSVNTYFLIFISDNFKEVDENSIPEVDIYLSTNSQGEIIITKLDDIDLHIQTPISNSNSIESSKSLPEKTLKDKLMDFFFKEHHPNCTCGQKTIKDAYHTDSCLERYKEVKQ